jgi:hypothetical protein
MTKSKVQTLQNIGLFPLLVYLAFFLEDPVNKNIFYKLTACREKASFYHRSRKGFVSAWHPDLKSFSPSVSIYLWYRDAIFALFELLFLS